MEIEVKPDETPSAPDVGLVAGMATEAARNAAKVAADAEATAEATADALQQTAQQQTIAAQQLAELAGIVQQSNSRMDKIENDLAGIATAVAPLIIAQAEEEAAEEVDEEAAEEQDEAAAAREAEEAEAQEREKKAAPKGRHRGGMPWL